MKSLIIIIVFVYFGLCLALFLFQKSILYYPQPAIGVDNQAETIQIDVGELELSGWVVNSGQQKAIIYYGGNAEVIEQNIPQFRRLFTNYTLYFIPYRGYGDNAGEPDESKLYSDALAVYNLVSKQHDTISLIGRSLGSGVATFVASERDVSKVALITPYDSIVSVAKTHYPFFPVSLLVNQKFLSIKRAPQIGVQVLILIAENDQVIPPKHSEALARAFEQRLLTKVTISNASHNDISNFQTFEKSLADYFSEL